MPSIIGAYPEKDLRLFWQTQPHFFSPTTPFFGKIPQTLKAFTRMRSIEESDTALLAAMPQQRQKGLCGYRCPHSHAGTSGSRADAPAVVWLAFLGAHTQLLLITMLLMVRMMVIAPCGADGFRFALG